MSWVNIQYESNLRKKDKRDGMKALAVYCLIMCSAFFQGWLYTTNTNIFVLNLSQIWIPLILTAGFFLFFYCSKENIRSIGINSVLFLSIYYPVKWVVSGAVSFDVLSIISSI